MKKPAFFFLVALLLMGVAVLDAAEARYALVIGNNNYRSEDIAPLETPVSDAQDIARSLRELGYGVDLRTNLKLAEMYGAIANFMAKLRTDPNSEGFFWFAGHGIAIEGQHHLLPVDVAHPMDEKLLKKESYAVDELMQEFEEVSNKTNLIIIDACRNRMIPNNRNRDRAVTRGGLAIISAASTGLQGNKVIYSTMAGQTADDGQPGSRNSPFAEAFLNNMKNPRVFETDVFYDIKEETLRLTGGKQSPYATGDFGVKNYSLAAVSATETYTPSPTFGTVTAAPASPVKRKPAPTPAPAGKTPQSQDRFNLDGKRAFGVSAAALINGASVPANVNARITAFERYGQQGKFFFIPNSWFASVDYFSDTHNVQDYSGIGFGAGFLWKIRLGQAQRFIVNFGPLADYFFFKYTYKAESGYFNSFGYGVQGGISFRISRYFSVDTNVLFLNTVKPVQTGNGFYPYTVGGSLGLSFLLPY
ncbi:hypothetical protein AGMMS50267_10630 [Spirochaetia bacterium]|nr:hypothetical protein AGMMS50267_10630 [Spirochaetia bacterium]